VLLAAPTAHAQAKPAAEAKPATKAATPAQRTFATAEEAAAALIKALKALDREAVLAVLGAGARGSAYSGDAIADRAAIERFAAMYDEKHAIVADGDARATLALGTDAWPFAYPLVKGASGWRFDTQAGNREILARRIGQNELTTISVMLAIVDAQRDYASADRDKSGLRSYARKFASTPGRRDGLFWKTGPGEPESPLGPLFSRAAEEGYKEGSPARPYHGYLFRMLTAQGAGAPGGAFNYVVKGRMIGGFAAIAHPAVYGRSGIMTFIVNHDGVVYQKDLGPDTSKRAAAITRFDPSDGWTAVKTP
jgi:hypothetical protein